MIDFFFAIMAAGINGADGGGNSATAQATPPAAVAPEATIAPLPVPQGDTLATATPVPTPTAPSSVIVGSGVVIGQGALLEGVATTTTPTATAPVVVAPAVPVPAATGFNMAVVPAGLVAEPQIPSGKFTTAMEVKPILGATKANWAAVREYEGKDYLYVSHVWGWRCGLSAMAISVNDEPMQNWPLPACHEKYTTPNAILEGDGLPVLTFRLGSVQTITIQVVYDDLSMDVTTLERGNVLIP